MALVKLKSNLANFRSNFSTTPIEKQVSPKGGGTKLDPVDITEYSGKTQFKKSFIEKSLYDRAEEYILKYNPRTQFSEKKIKTSKFNLEATVNYNTTTSRFTDKFVKTSKFNPDNISQYSTTSRFTDKFVKTSKFNIDDTIKPFSKGTAMNPSLKYPTELQSKYNWVGNIPPAVNFQDDLKSNAKGFTTNLGKSGDKEKSQFISFDYTKAIPTANSKYDFGDSTLTNQLGTGSPFPQFPGADHLYKWLPVAHTGFHTRNTYGAAAGKEGFLKATYTTNSPIDDQYKKFNLRDESYNPTYMGHPLILRGIQRKGNQEPQRWGFGVNFDDGLIRAGAVTTAERLAIDTVRIAKWMASPKGLLWVVKQVGLGLTNPKVETNPNTPGPLGMQTRIHTGLTSLLSVAGSPLGLHFTTHGLPFANEVASYENVHRQKILGNNEVNFSNRLVDLKKSLFPELEPVTISDAIDFLVGASPLDNTAMSAAGGITVGMPLPEVSGQAGPQSVYGIGRTDILRRVDTQLDAVKKAIDLYNFSSKYSFKEQYAILESNSKDKSSSSEYNGKKNGRREINPIGISKQIGNITGKQSGFASNADKSKADPNTPVNPINDYVTLAYGLIPKDSNAKRDLKGDFRNELTDNVGFTGKKADADYYAKNNLETRYGFGTPGKVGANRTNPGEFLVKSFSGKKADRTALALRPDFRGDRVNALDVTTQQVLRSEVYPDGAEDIIKFYFEDGNQGTNVMPFRCTMTGFSDSFSPGWDSISIMGRPDGAYMYSSFERSISFTFIVAALSRSEMIPMWRRLNKLASYTMPDFSNGARPSGPMMRISIGSLFQQTPGFITSLSYTIPDDASWDIADDHVTNKAARQLPTVVEVAVSFTIVGDFRPQKDGRVYSLQSFTGKTGDADDWINNAKKTSSKEIKEEEQFTNTPPAANATGTTTTDATTNAGSDTPPAGNDAPVVDGPQTQAEANAAATGPTI